MSHFIITYGPAGSGKGYVRQYFIEELNKLYPDQIIQSDNIFEAEIDQYIEADDEYKKMVLKIMCDYFTTCANDYVKGQGTFTQHLRNKLQSPGECNVNILARQLQTAYMAIRAKYNYILDNDLKKAVEENKKDIVFETTGTYGTNPLDWLWHCPKETDDKPWKGPLCKQKQNITIVFPFVKANLIIEQALSRFITAIMSWYKCLKNCQMDLHEKNFSGFLSCLSEQNQAVTPRVPDLEQLEKLIPNAQTNLIPYITNNMIDNIIIFNNDRSLQKPTVIALKSNKTCKYDNIDGLGLKPELVKAIKLCATNNNHKLM